MRSLHEAGLPLLPVLVVSLGKTVPSPEAGIYPDLLHFFADSAYAGEHLRKALAGLGAWYFEIIRRSDDIKGFAVLPRRWVVERTFAWLGRCRRLAKDFEATIRSATAWILVAHIRLLTRKLARAA